MFFKRKIEAEKIITTKINVDKEIDLSYVPLIPKDDIEIVDQDRAYSDLLNAAIHTDGVKNIAVTGTYGSGKSSVINAYLKNSIKNNKKFVKISLATFEEKSDADISISTETATIENKVAVEADKVKKKLPPLENTLEGKVPTVISEKNKEKIKNEDIEKSILKQLFYSVEAKEIPNSRFRKIKDTSIGKKILFSLLASIFILSILSLFFIGLLKNAYKELSFICNDVVKNLAFVSALFFVLLIVFIIIWKTINSLDKGKEIKKLKVSDFETEFKNSSDSSIFNVYLEEILYFFKKTNTKIVIFEDLDRFDSVEIFINLRELNTLLNSHLKDDKIIFIYAIKDDMFINYDRTKFFDYIIPVIPVISSYNSAEMAIRKVKGTIYENVLDPDFLNEVMPYVDDYRTLDNIFNEFKLYNKKFEKLELNAKKLLCMIVYKNLHPQDFALLNSDQGLVYNCFKNFRNAIEVQMPKLIEERERIVSYLNNNSKEYMDLTEYKRSLFLLLTNGNSYFEIYRNSPYSRDSISLSQFMQPSFDLSKIDDKIPVAQNNNLTVTERYKSIESKTKEKLKEYEKRLSEIRQKIAELSALNLTEFIGLYGSEDIFNDEIKKHPAIIKYLSKGYIDETYHSYITNHYFENLTRNDFCFVDAVKCYKKLSPKFELIKIDNILKQLNRNDFRKREILNYNLIQYLLYNKSSKNIYSEFLSVLFEQLSDGAEESLSFIDSFFEFVSDKEIYIKEMFTTSPLIWKTINEGKSFEESRKLTYIKLIVETCDIEILKIMNEKDNIKNMIENNNQIIGMFELNKGLLFKKDKSIYILNNFKGLNVKFKVISKDLIGNPLNKLICQNNLFEINSEMIIHALQTFDIPYKEAQKNNYQQIMDCKSTVFKAYIDDKIQFYVDNVLLQKPELDETQETLKDFLARTTLTEESKEKIINKINIQISSFEGIDKKYYDLLIKHNKVFGTWDIINQYYIAFGVINENLSKILNLDIFTTSFISDIKTLFGQDEAKFKKLFKDILCCKLICIKNYIDFIKNSPCQFEFEAFQNIDEENYSALAKSNIIIETDDIAEKFLRVSNKAFILYFENHNEYVSRKISSTPFGAETINLLIKSNLTDAIKVFLLEKNIANIHPSSKIEAEKILYFLNTRLSTQTLSIAQIKNILTLSSEMNANIYFSANQIRNFEEAEIKIILDMLGVDFSKLIDKSITNPEIFSADETVSLLESLKYKGLISGFHRKKKGKLTIIF